MKKNLWVLLAISALIAMFVIAGCQKAVVPTPTPTPKPTPTPTAVPIVNPCPTKATTEVKSIYFGSDLLKDPSTGDFSLYITFDKDISLLDATLANWQVKVFRSVPYKTAAGIEKVYTPPKDADGDYAITAHTRSVTKVGSRTIQILASVSEFPFGIDKCIPVYWDGLLAGLFEGDLEGEFRGLFAGRFFGLETLDGFLGEEVGGVDVPAEVDTHDTEIHAHLDADVCGEVYADLDGTFDTGVDGSVNGHFEGTINGAPVDADIEGDELDGEVIGRFEGTACGHFEGEFEGTFDGTIFGFVEIRAINGFFEIVRGFFFGRVIGGFEGTVEGIFVGLITLSDEWCAVPYYGLICAEASYAAYFDALYGTNPIENYWLKVNTPFNATAGAKYKDNVKWAYKGGIAPIGDVTGLPCSTFCTLSGEGCCEVDCVTCTANPCPVGTTCP